MNQNDIDNWIKNNCSAITTSENCSKLLFKSIFTIFLNLLIMMSLISPKPTSALVFMVADYGIIFLFVIISYSIFIRIYYAVRLLRCIWGNDYFGLSVRTKVCNQDVFLSNTVICEYCRRFSFILNYLLSINLFFFDYVSWSISLLLLTLSQIIIFYFLRQLLYVFVERLVTWGQFNEQIS